MARAEGYQLKLLYLMKIFLEETDEQHPMMVEDLIRHLEGYGIGAARKSIGEDIERLRAFGMDIVHIRSRQGGYFLARRQFELPELKLLVDVVQASKFLTEKKSNELIKKLESLTSHYEANQLQRQVYVTNRVKTINENIYQNVDILHTAMHKDVMIRFKYYEWNVNKEMVLKKGGNDYIVSPWMLVWDDENYYLRAFDGAAGIVKHYRVDKMLDIRLTGDKRYGRQYFDNLDSAVFAKKTFGMFSGQEQDVKLCFENRLIGVAIDRFGKDIMTRPVDEGHFNVSVRVAVSPQFFGWAAALGTGVKIEYPKTVAKEYQLYLKKLLEQYETIGGISENE